MSTAIYERGYAHPEVLVSTEWVAAHLDDPNVRIVESNEDPLLYPSGHIPGAVQVDWTTDLNDQVRRDYLKKAGFESLMSRIGVTPKTRRSSSTATRTTGGRPMPSGCSSCSVTATRKIMDGGRAKWEREGRPMTRDVPEYAPTQYSAPERDDSTIRAFREQVLAHQQAGKPLIDVRSPAEYSGERLHMPDYPNEGALRGGHIPGAKNVPWSKAVNPDDGTFRSADELQDALRTGAGLEARIRT